MKRVPVLDATLCANHGLIFRDHARVLFAATQAIAVVGGQSDLGSGIRFRFCAKFGAKLFVDFLALSLRVGSMSAYRLSSSNFDYKGTAPDKN